MLGGLGLSITLILFGYNQYKTVADLRKEHQDTVHRLESRVDKLETMIDPFWQMIKMYLPKMLNVPGSSENLIEELVKGTITPLRLKELECKLQDQLTTGENDKFSVMMALWMVVVYRKEHSPEGSPRTSSKLL